jgi:hypothetical protein
MELRLPSGSALDTVLDARSIVDAAGHSVVDEPTEEDVRLAVAAMGDGNVEFVIVASADAVFVQAAGDGDGPYALQRCDGDPDAMAQAEGAVDREAVLATLLAFRAGDPSWEGAHEWVALGGGRPEGKRRRLFGRH